MKTALLVFSLVSLAPAQAIDVTPYVLPVNAANRGAEIAEIHAAYDLDPDAADFGGKKIPGVWRSNGLVTGLMGILRFGPAVPAFLCWKQGSEEFCPPFTSGVGGARMTRMQSDAITVTYSPFSGVTVEQTIMAVNARLLRSRARVRSTRPVRLTATLHGGIIEQSETGHIKEWKRLPATPVEREGVRYAWTASGAEIEAGPGKTAEVEFSLEFGSQPVTGSFDELLAERQKQSERFYATVPRFDFKDAQLNLFHRILWERLRGLAENPAGAIPYRYFMGTSAPWGIDGLWIWDSVFVSVVLQASDPQWAQQLLEAVLAQQYESGLVPHWSTPNSRTEISQAPLLSWAAWRLYNLHGDREFLARVYPRLVNLHLWYEKERTRADGLPFWKQPDESGMDNSPAFDEGTDAHVDLASELFADAGMLAEIAAALGRRAEAQLWQRNEQSWRQRISRMWDGPGGFYFPMKGDKRIPVYGIQGFFPLWDVQLEPERRAALLKRLTDPAQFWTKAPVPSVSLKSPQFMQPKWFANTYGSPETGRRATERLEDYTSVYWRGPTWVFSNAIIYEGLRRSREFTIANELGRRMFRMLFEASRYGGMLWENFDPRDGKPSRLLPKGQADEMAASIYFLKALYDSQVGLETAAPPTHDRLRLRYTAAPKADVENLQFGPWKVSQRVVGDDVRLTLPPGAEVENHTGRPLRVNGKVLAPSRR